MKKVAMMKKLQERKMELLNSQKKLLMSEPELEPIKSIDTEHD
jgi:hypothetical protein